MPKTSLFCLMVMASMVLVGAPPQLEAHHRYAKKGLASWYGKAFTGRSTASGQRFSPREMTAAHRTLPLGTKVMVENLQTGNQVEVKINDRGPYVEPRRRIIDLSRAAADSLGFLEHGVGVVRVVMTEPALSTQDADYEIQVGAFTAYREAQRVLQQVQHRSLPSYIARRDGLAGPYYRVRVGPFATVEQADRVAKTLQRAGYYIFLDEVPDTAVMG